MDNEAKHNYLKKSKTFCMFPWIHMYTEPDGRTFPCCTAEQNTITKNTKDNTLVEIFNSDDWNKLRLDMLNDNKNSICRRCHEVDAVGSPSYRTFANKEFGQYVDIIDETNEDGSVNKFELKYIDLRFSNQCNFACASCSPAFSTKWIQILKTRKDEPWTQNHPYNRINNNSKEDYVEQLKPHMKDSYQIYFAGGEPLIIDDHYRLLEYLDNEKIYNVNLRYNTNLSNLNYKKVSIVEYWKKFKKIQIGASIDAVGTIAETIRHGTVWSQIENNIRTLLPYENITLNYDTTISILNISHLPEFYDYILKNNLFKKSTWFTTNIAFTPVPFSITSLPDEVKAEITTTISDYAESLKMQKVMFDVSALTDITNKMYNIVEFMNSKNTFDPTEFAYAIDGTLWHTDNWEKIPYLKYIWDRYVPEPIKKEIDVRRSKYTPI